MPNNLSDQDSLNIENVLGKEENSESKQQRLDKLEDEIATMPDTLNDEKAGMMLDLGTLYLDFQRQQDAWDIVWPAFEYYKSQEQWELAVVACDILMSTEQKDSVKALAHGIWLSITYPVNPETTVAILQHLIDESPPGSDTQAVAAVTAHYIADIRKPAGKAGENLIFFTSQRLAETAAKHKNISNQDEFDIWMEGNQFNNPDSFLPKLSLAVDAMVADDWWIDRDALKAKIEF